MYKSPNLGQVLSASIVMKGWDELPEPGTTIWIVKNIGGTYHKPYDVTVVATHAQGNEKACLIYVDTHIDGYYSHVSSVFDIIGESKEDVEDKVAKLIIAHKSKSESLTRAVENLKNSLLNNND